MKRFLLLAIAAAAFVPPSQARAADFKCAPSNPAVTICRVKSDTDTSWFLTVWANTREAGLDREGGVVVGQGPTDSTGVALVLCLGLSESRDAVHGGYGGRSGCYFHAGGSSLYCPVKPPPAPNLGPYIP
jgi:ABC-type sugar transport system substrate-binding protein